MSIVFDPASATRPRGWALLTGFWHRFAGEPAADTEERKSARAIRQLSRLDDYGLSDIGLCRSDLTPECLADAAARRARRQAALDAEIAQSAPRRTRA